MTSISIIECELSEWIAKIHAWAFCYRQLKEAMPSCKIAHSFYLKSESPYNQLQLSITSHHIPDDLERISWGPCACRWLWSIDWVMYSLKCKTPWIQEYSVQIPEQQRDPWRSHSFQLPVTEEFSDSSSMWLYSCRQTPWIALYCPGLLQD